MKKPEDYAKILIEKAKRDAILYDKIKDDTELSNDVIGFHIQQAVEKSLKALLSINNISFRRTHDIRELLDLLADNNITLPETFNSLDEWTPYAVGYRYEEVEMGDNDFNRDKIQKVMWDLIRWVENNIQHR